MMKKTMKNKIASAKSLFTLSISMFSLLGVITATIAWFAVQRNNYATSSSITVSRKTSNLVLSYINIDGGLIQEEDENQIILHPQAGTALKDVSGNGKTLFKPKWTVDDYGTRTKAQSIQPAQKATDYYEFMIFAEATWGTAGFHVFLGADNADFMNVRPSAGQNDEENVRNAQAAKSVRIAILNSDNSTAGDADDELVLLWNPQGGETNTHAYGNPTSPQRGGFLQQGTGSAFGVNGYQISPISSLGNTYQCSNTFGTYSNFDEAQAANAPYLGEIAANSGKYFIFRIFAEGQDEDTTIDALLGKIDLNLTIYVLHE